MICPNDIGIWCWVFGIRFSVFGACFPIISEDIPYLSISHPHNSQPKHMTKCSCSDYPI